MTAISTVSAAARGRLAERLVPVAMAFVGAVRDVDGDGIAEFLKGLSGDERLTLLVILAAMVPHDQAPQDLLAWVDWDEFGAPLPEGAQMVLYSPYRRGGMPASCGTRGAYQRHLKAQEPPCDPCRAAESDYQTGRRAAGKESAA
jgi:hypothetical protein